MTRKGPVQKLVCLSCKKNFSNDPSPGSQYPLKVILHSMELYNSGRPASFIKREMGKRYHLSPPVRTIYSWTERYRTALPFLKLRSMYELDPDEIIKMRTFDHQQVFPFRYHTLKLNICAKRFPGLKRYIEWVLRSLPDRMFMEGPRASTTQLDIELAAERMNDIAPKMCSMALERSSDPSSAHSSIEDFFIVNDDRTVCTELPVFLNPSEVPRIEVRSPLTGHIDIVQMRYDDLWVLDYKPDLNKPEKASSQMALYPLIVTSRPCTR